MKAKMKDNWANRAALLYMIGQVQQSGIEVTTLMVAAFAGLSKTTVLKRLHQLEMQGYLIRRERTHRPEVMAYVWELPQEHLITMMREGSRQHKEYQSWRAKVLHVAGIRAGSQKAMFI